MEKQVTLATEVTYSGIGLHSGKDVTMTLQPGKPGTGIVFVRTDLPGQPEIHARAELVTSTLKDPCTGGTGDFHTESYYPE